MAVAPSTVPNHPPPEYPIFAPPAAHPATTVIVEQPQATTIVLPATDNERLMKGHRDWSTGICSCCDDCKVCMCALFCMPCLLCSISMRMKENCLLPWFCGTLGVMMLRVKLRTAYGIRGSICEDIICMNECPLLTIMQLARELDHVGL